MNQVIPLYLEFLEKVIEVHDLPSHVGVQEVVRDALQAQVVAPYWRH